MGFIYANNLWRIYGFNLIDTWPIIWATKGHDGDDFYPMWSMEGAINGTFLGSSMGSQLELRTEFPKHRLDLEMVYYHIFPLYSDSTRARFVSLREADVLLQFYNAMKSWLSFPLIFTVIFFLVGNPIDYPWYAELGGFPTGGCVFVC